MLAPLDGRPVIYHTLTNAAKAKIPLGVVLATSEDDSDNDLESFALSNGFACYRGSLDDVRQRIYDASEGHDYVVRITGDCPCIDPTLIDQCCQEALDYDLDYATNTLPPTYPDGYDVEVVRRELLESRFDHCSPLISEHVTGFIRLNRSQYRCFNITSPMGDESRYSLTVDDPGDIEAIETYLTGGDMPVKGRNEGLVHTFVEYLDSLHPRPVLRQQVQQMERLRRVIPGGAQTFSKMPHRCSEGFGPMVYSYHTGTHLIDTDDNAYLDFILGLGPQILGSPEASTNECPALPSIDEAELAELICDIYPGAEMCRFFKNGSDACAASVRLARHVTGRSVVISYGYHGCQDWCCTEGPLSSGSVGSNIVHEQNLTDVARSVDKRCAAVIIEPANQQTMTPDEALRLRRACDEHGTLLIFDEVVTMPRIAMGGCAEYYGVTPDLACMGKGLGGGAPISVLAGKRRHMERFTDIFYSTTFGGELGAIRQTIDTIHLLRYHDYPRRCNRLGSYLKEWYNKAVANHDLTDVTECVGLDGWPIITFRDAYGYDALQYFSFFQQEVLRRGILYNGNHFFSMKHNEDHVVQAATTYNEALRLLRSALDYKILDRAIIGHVNTGGVRRA
jgi:glutamate-1-semialdehyde 2,1-aminomutase/spore coat polysaccharide biosynthesis protein SpsF